MSRVPSHLDLTDKPASHSYTLVLSAQKCQDILESEHFFCSDGQQAPIHINDGLVEVDTTLMKNCQVCLLLSVYKGKMERGNRGRGKRRVRKGEESRAEQWRGEERRGETPYTHRVNVPLYH